MNLYNLLYVGVLNFLKDLLPIKQRSDLSNINLLDQFILRHIYLLYINVPLIQLFQNYLFQSLLFQCIPLRKTLILDCIFLIKIIKFKLKKLQFNKKII